MRLIPLEGRDRLLFVGMLSIALAQSLVVMVPAWIVQQLFDRISSGRHQGTLSVTALIMLFMAMALTVVVMEIVKRRLGAEMALRHAASIRQKLFQRQIAVAASSSRSQGSLLLPFVGDLSASRRWVGEGLVRGGSSAILIPVMISVIATRSGTMAAALGLVLLLSLAGSLILVRPMDAAVRDVRKRRGALTGFVSGRIAAAATIYTSGRVTLELGKVEARTEKLSQAERRRAWAVGATRGVALMTNSLLVMATLLVGMTEAKRGGASIGEIAAVLTLVGLLGAGVTELARAFELWRPAKIAYERIDRVLSSRPPRALRGTGPAQLARGLTLDQFSVPHCVQHASALLPEGSAAVLDGAAGTGKSALIRAIAQIADHDGTALVNGRQLERLGERTRSRTIGFASVELPILPGSLGMNLRYRARDVSDEELIALGRQCGLGALMERLGGLNGRIAGNSELSAGERQSVALGRALAGTPPLLLLDSIDAHLDQPVCAWLAKRLQSYPGTVLIVASRPELRAIAAARWTLSGGRLAVAPAELMTNVVPFEKGLS